MVESSGPEVLVRLLDVGSQERVPAERLRVLPREVTRLPPASLMFAFRGGCSDTAPVKWGRRLMGPVSGLVVVLPDRTWF